MKDKLCPKCKGEGKLHHLGTSELHICHACYGSGVKGVGEIREQSKRDWSAESNAQPESIRIIFCAMEQQVRIQQLIAEKMRLAARHRESLAEINESIAYAEQCLKRLEQQAELL